MMAKLLVPLLIALAIAMPAPVRAAADEEARILTCLQSAADAFQIDVLPLVLLRQVEAGHVGSEVRNTNGTTDLGPMQINSSWLGRLGKFGLTRELVRDDACVNAYVGAWIFYVEWKATGNVAMAMARYHSPTPAHQQRYLFLVRKVIERNLASLAKASAGATLASAP